MWNLQCEKHTQLPVALEMTPFCRLPVLESPEAFLLCMGRLLCATGGLPLNNQLFKITDNAFPISQALDNSRGIVTLLSSLLYLSSLLLWHAFCLRASCPHSVFSSSKYYDGQTVHRF